MRVLVVNAGSSSLKLRALDANDAVLASYDLAPGDPVPAGLPEVDAVGHRIVHGGTEFQAAVRIDPQVVRRLEALTDLAPLHQPKSLDALKKVAAVLPEVPAVACFDTAFHATLPDEASTYALPKTWRERYRIRRYGFHGLSHAYASRRAAELLGRFPQGLRVVTCHLGAGASLTAVKDGRSVDTTMGFTPLEGVPMATRSGDVDPGLLVWLLEHEGISAGELGETLERRSGVLGLTGTADLREVLARQDPDARLGLAVYVHRLRSAIAGMTAALGGLDGLVFTGGVGENSAPIRARVAQGLGFLGVALDPARNQAAQEDGDVSADGARVRALVVHAREDLEIARQVRAVLAG